MSETTTTPAVANVPAAKPRKRKRIFMWTFLAIQAGFLAWIISGRERRARPVRRHADRAGPAMQATPGGRYSRARPDCVVHYGGALNTAGAHRPGPSRSR